LFSLSVTATAGLFLPVAVFAGGSNPAGDTVSERRILPDEEERDQYEGPLELHFESCPVAFAATFYAEITGKEVFVSATVAQRVLNIFANGITKVEAIKLFEEEVKQQGMKIVSFDEGTLAIVANEEAKARKEKGEPDSSGNDG
jgi:type II secretory pathway component GspD/PulD (secretin)